MRAKTVRFTLILLLALLVSAPHCWAKSKGYLYVVGYSIAKKKVFFSSVIVQKVRDVSYSDEEYVTEVELIQKLESQFQDYMASAAYVTPSEYTVSARGAYKSKEIADKRLKVERDRYTSKGYAVSLLRSFVFSD